MPAPRGEDYRDYGRDRYRDDYDDRGRHQRISSRPASRAPSLVVCLPSFNLSNSVLTLTKRDDRGPPEAPQAPIVRVDSSHIYPPKPIPMIPPYPTTAGALIAMPPDDNYPLSRYDDRLDARSRQVGRARSTGARYRDDDRYYDDHGYDRDDRDRHGRRRRSRSRSNSRDRYGHHDKKDHHLAASVAGAVAGGLIGREASKGDWKSTVAGAVVGALGANAAERTWEAHQRKDKRQEDNWEYKWGRR
jgi:hypothetical protein